MKKELINFLDWMNKINASDPMRLETDSEDIVEMYLAEKFGGQIASDARQGDFQPGQTSEVAFEKELTKIIDAGNVLAEAAHRLQKEYDGIHRLRLALSNWYKVRADEFGRGLKRSI